MEPRGCQHHRRQPLLLLLLHLWNRNPFPLHSQQLLMEEQRTTLLGVAIEQSVRGNVPFKFALQMQPKEQKCKR